MNKFTEEKLKYIQEKIEQGYELEKNDEYDDDFCLYMPVKKSDKTQELFNEFLENFKKDFPTNVAAGHELIKYPFVIYYKRQFENEIEFPPLKSISQVLQIIDIYDFITTAVYLNKAKGYIEIQVY